MVTTTPGPAKQPPSPWPGLRQRGRTLIGEIYAEAVSEVVIAAHKALPPSVPGPPSRGARIANLLLAGVASLVGFVGHVEKLLGRGNTGGMPVHQVREATLGELERGEGALKDNRLLPSAYEVWVGPRPNGYLRLRYAYDAPKLSALLPPSVRETCACRPLTLDDETVQWVEQHVKTPCPTTRLHVWRALKRRLYHYDAGVIAFRDFPRNYLLSSGQWRELLDGHSSSEAAAVAAAGTPRPAKGVALDIGAGDGSLNEPMRALFTSVTATELTTPLVLRLCAVGLEGMVAEEPTPECLGGKDHFDCVCILNVLDRCKDPFLMLEQAKALLPADGHLVVSVVLPATQSDAAASTGTSQRRWDVRGADFETAAAALVRNVLVPSGFTPRRIVRAPYFCAGDRYSPVAALDACVVVLTPTPAGASAAGTPDEAAAAASPPKTPATGCEDCE